MNKWMKLTILAVAVALLAAAPAALAAQRPVGGQGGVIGTVTALGTDSLTVLTTGGAAVVVTTSGSTRVEILATGSAGSLSDIVAGSKVEVRGRGAAEGSVAAEVITVTPTGDQLRGGVIAIAGATITVQLAGGASATIVTTSSTTFRKDQATASLSDVAAGQNLQAYGTLASGSSLAATLVLIQPGWGGGTGGMPGNAGAVGPVSPLAQPDRPASHGTSGAVTAVGTNSLTVLTADGTAVAVVTSSSTRVEIVATGATGSLSDIVTGSQVEVRGPQNSDGSITADVIMVTPAAGELGGQVTAVTDATIAVQGPDGTTASIVTTAATTFRSGQETASLSAVAADQFVRAYGTLQSDGSLAATLVLIQGAMGGGPGGPGGMGSGPGGMGGPSGMGGPGGMNGGAGGPGGMGGGPGGMNGGPGGPGDSH